MSEQIKICHISDLHGRFLDIKEDFDIVVCTGDHFPNSTRGNKNIEVKFQEKYFKENIERFLKMVKFKPFFWLPGNHDFFNPLEALQEEDVECYDLTDRFVKYKDKTFYGFPYINFMHGEWNYEKTAAEMESLVDTMLKKFDEEGTPDILCAHAPLYGLLDSDGTNSWGNFVLADKFFNFEPNKLPRHYLHGHVHESFGGGEFNSMLVSNASTKYRIVEI